MVSISWAGCSLILFALLVACWAVGARRRLLRLHAAARAARDAWRSAPAQDAEAARARFEAAAADYEAARAQRPARWLARLLRSISREPL